MKIKCENKKCIEANNKIPYQWDYKGNSSFYASCPRCKSNIKINSQKEENKMEVENGNTI